MSKGRHSIKILGLSLLAAFALMAVSVSAAQAGHFAVGNPGTPLGPGVIKGVLGTGTKGELLTQSGILIGCTASAMAGTLATAGIAHVTLTFTGCTVLGNVNCEVYPTLLDHEMLTNVGKIEAVGLGTVILHNGEHYIVAENKTGPLTIVYFHKGPKACLLDLKNEITGNEAFFMPTALIPLLTQELRTLTVAQRTLLNAPLVGGGLNLGIQLKFNGQNADFEVPNTTPGSEAGILKVHLTSDELLSAL